MAIMRWDHVKAVTVAQRKELYGSIADFERAEFQRDPAKKVSWRSIERLGQGVLPDGVDNKTVPAMEKALRLKKWTLKYLAEGDLARAAKLPNDEHVVEQIERLQSVPEPTESQQQDRMA